MAIGPVLKLLPNWKKVLRCAWSARLALIAALFSAADVGFGYWLDGKPALLSAIAFVISVSAAVARLIAQPKTLHEE